MALLVVGRGMVVVPWWVERVGVALNEEQKGWIRFVVLWKLRRAAG
jgi:hypothetical protein